MKYNLRNWIRILHRDIGYIAAGLTLVYAISGIAVNHIDDWNPNYSIEIVETKLEPMPDSIAQSSSAIKIVLNKLGETGKVKNTFRPEPESIRIFVEGNTIEVNFKTGLVREEKVISRAIIRETNFLHLNAPKKIWTYIADVFAVALVFLAVTGLFMIKGKKGITGRGAWLAATGLLIPIIFLLLYF